MGKIKTIVSDLHKTKKFLEYSKNNATKEKIAVLMCVNIFALYIILYYSDREMIREMFMGVNIGFFLIGLFCFTKIIKYSDMKMCLVYAIYKIQSVINVFYIISLLLKEEKNHFIIVGILFVITICISVFSFRYTIREINMSETYHNRDVEKGIAASVGTTAGGIRSGRGIEFYDVCFICCVTYMLYNASSIVYYFIKAYCYYIQEKDRKESIIPKEDILLVGMQRCSTCQNAKSWLEKNGIPYVFRDIEKKEVGFYEIKNWHEKSNLPIERFVDVNVSSYKKMRLKEKLPKMTLEEQYELLASKNILLKSPILVSNNCICVGFKENEWSEHKGKIKT